MRGRAYGSFALASASALLVSASASLLGCDAIERAAGGGNSSLAPPPDERAPDARLGTRGDVVVYDAETIRQDGRGVVAGAGARFGVEGPPLWVNASRCTEPIVVGPCEVFECASGYGGAGIDVDVWPSAGVVEIRGASGTSVTLQPTAQDRSYVDEFDEHAIWTPFEPLRVSATGRDTEPFTAEVSFPGPAVLRDPADGYVHPRGEMLNVTWDPPSEDIDLTIDGLLLGMGPYCSDDRCNAIAHCELHGGSATLPAAVFSKMDTSVAPARIETRSIHTAPVTAGRYGVRVSAISAKAERALLLR